MNNARNRKITKQSDTKEKLMKVFIKSSNIYYQKHSLKRLNMN